MNDIPRLMPGAARLLRDTEGAGAFAEVRRDFPGVRGKVDGQARFAIDVRLTGMKFAAVKNAPVLGAKVSTIGLTPEGTLAVNLGTAVAVVAADSWAARKALNALEVTWTQPSYAQRSLVDSAMQASGLTRLLGSSTAAVAEASPPGATPSSVAGIINSQPRKLNLTYSQSMLAHACLEVSNCTVEPLYETDGVRLAGINVWCPAQSMERVLDTVCKLLPALPRACISVTMLPPGGGMNSKPEQECVSQTVQVALPAGGPVKLMWWREEDFARGSFTAAAVSRIQVGIDGEGDIQGWYNRIVAPSAMRSHGLVPPGVGSSSFADTLAVGSAVSTGDEPMPYADAMSHRVVDYVEQKTGFAVGFRRAAGQSISCFAVESAIDECARLLGKDPFRYRLGLVGARPPLKALLEDVANLAGWDTPLPAGTARGIALSPGFASSYAVVAEVSCFTGGTSNSYRVNRIFCSAASGNEAQVASSIVQAMSAARWGRMQFDRGVAQVRNFARYRIARMAEAPEVVVRVLEPGLHPEAQAEPGVAAVAPALANAFAALTGSPCRSLPLGM